jgi:hypothetical protein
MITSGVGTALHNNLLNEREKDREEEEEEIS